MPITGLDHAMLAVRDLDTAAAALTGALGLHVRRGGRHPGWGTANAVLDLRSGYLELITVADPAEAAAVDAGRRILELLDRDGGGWLAFVLTAKDLRTTWQQVRRAGLSIARPVGGRAVRPDGSYRSWAVAGHGEEFRTGRLPSLIEYGDGTPPPREDPPSHGPAPDVLGVARLDVAVADLDAATRRYARLLGGPPVAEPGHCACWTLPDGVGVRLLPIDLTTATREGLWTVALAVPDARAAAAVLDARGTGYTPAGPGAVLVDRGATAPARIVLTELREGWDVRAAAV
ncbi:VOC family protein [Actinokineospora auranticolor]|uniref:Glyoxalase-like protein n=1 Tax=Actinokineospora auranticolor TaxID=155976 RepID=A0A2S6GD47_9PSEU|nr:VOC family protein [Actinokineospora auranticolor]PPK63168.1 glyoxalase-like protein [Actinokineospora auranticolor]